MRTSDYSAASVLAILDDTNAGALVSFNNSDGQTYVDVHCAFLEACRRSRSCRRFIPAEFAGNVDDFPLLPSYFQTSRVPFRRILERETGVEWTVFNNGWLMDYLLTRDKTYMPWIPNEFPIDPNNWTACIRGTGDQVQSFTSARDVARALIMLLDAPEWASFLSFWLLMRSDTVKERTTYITGQWSTFNDMVRFMEAFHGPSSLPVPTALTRPGRPMDKTYRSEQDIRRDSALPPTAENAEARYLASVEEMMVTGSGACPRDKTLRQRGRFFGGLGFTTLEGLLVQTGSSRCQTI